MERVATQDERSCGGVLWRRDTARGLEICLIATKGRTRWQLPKGHVSPGETEADAARREVREETGCDGEIEDDLGEIQFWFFVGTGSGRRRIRKSVRFFLVHYRAGETRDHDGEVDDAAWLPAEEAARKLTFDSERAIVVKALATLHGRPAP